MQRGTHHTKETKEAIRKAHLGKPGKKHSAKTKKLLSDWYWKHRKESENEENTLENKGSPKENVG